MTDLLIYGNGQMATLAHYYLTVDSPFDVVAFCVDRDYAAVSELDGLPVLGLDEATRRHPPDSCRAFVAMGYGRVNRDRQERFTRMKELGYSCVSYVSSQSVLASNVELGENCFIMEGSILQPFVRVGDDVTIGPGNCVGHHGDIQDHCFLASGAELSGNVTIEPYCFIGANVTIRNAVTIGREAVIGAGSVIMKSTEAKEVYVSPRAQLLPLPSDKLPRI